MPEVLNFRSFPLFRAYRGLHIWRQWKQQQRTT